MNGSLIDSLVIVFALIYNFILSIVFVLRALDREHLEWKFGYVFNGLDSLFRTLVVEPTDWKRYWALNNRHASHPVYNV